MPISPWDCSVSLPSPDGSLTAVIRDAVEIGMGAPTRGKLALSNRMSLEDCNPSLVWSEDSQLLAVPQWHYGPKPGPAGARPVQWLAIISPGRRQVRYAPGIYRVLELHAFAGGVVRGVDSPAYAPRPFEVDVSRIEWE
ncbi:MAG: hypothetical protein HY618_03475 [Candidatus Tectomicrobia bacterium]|uniref:Uncharacterized protein n=1 Tax=Tectimicrobiota bacterium TaxID=2528274 RepID=A0A933E7J7_UNCTE|nr:hypothetical protein [Candidatus Tectomicrobia bacterium]